MSVAEASPVRVETVALARLAVPVILTQVATTLMGLVDTLMVARLGTDALAATSLGSVWVFGTLLPAMGVLFGMDPIVTQAHGARDTVRTGAALRKGLVVAALVTLPVAALWLVTDRVLLLAGQRADLAALAHDYAVAQVFSIPFFLGFTALRHSLSGRGVMRPAMWITWLANGVNAVLNWALIFGHLGFEPHGVVGAGVATGLSRVFMFLALLAFVLGFNLHERALFAWDWTVLRWRELRELVGHGVSTGAQVGLEVWGFQSVALLAGRLGAEALAAHSIVLHLASLTFMVPFGLSMAAATRVGNLLGAGDARGSRRAAWVAIATGASFMALSGVTFLLLRWRVPALWRPAPEVLALAVGIMPIAGAFQVFDGTQAVGCGVLRGRGDTRPAALFNLVGYYALGIPLAYLLAFHVGLGLRGLWWGLTLGLFTVAVLLLVRVRRQTKVRG